MTTIHRPDPVTAPPSTPWWRHPIMWLVVGGPAVVVVAGVVTAVIAIRGADPVLDTSADHRTSASAQQAAIQARNHAATPPARP